MVDDNVFVFEDKRVVVEGLYLSRDQDTWRELSSVFDESWFVDVDRELAVKRVIERHITSGVANTREDADKRSKRKQRVWRIELRTRREDEGETRLSGVSVAVGRKRDCDQSARWGESQLCSYRFNLRTVLLDTIGNAARLPAC